jgi:hypothetical protein
MSRVKGAFWIETVQMRSLIFALVGLFARRIGWSIGWRLSFKKLPIILICQGAAISNHLGIDSIANENGMGPEVDLIKNLCLQQGDGVLGHKRAASYTLCKLHF